MLAREETEVMESNSAKELDTPESMGELAKAMLVAGIIALVIRSFLFEPFNIPSESMLPTLKVGDYLFVEKYSYGYSRFSFPLGIIPFKGRILQSSPERGDVAVFRHPKKPDVDYIKRIIGLPGDKIQVKGGILNINGQPVMRDFRNSETASVRDANLFYNRYIETLPNGVKHYIYEASDDKPLDNTPVYEVPMGYYFAMGDNRDNSLDSRVQSEVGFVPAENLIGRAWFLFFSTDGVKDKCNYEGSMAPAKTLLCKIVEYPKAIRFERLFNVINRI